MIQVGGGGSFYPGVSPDGTGGLNARGNMSCDNLTVFAVGLYEQGIVVGNNLLIVREGQHNSGARIKNGLGLFGVEPIAAKIVGGVRVAGAGYTANEQAMLEAVYTALQAIGLIT